MTRKLTLSEVMTSELPLVHVSLATGGSSRLRLLGGVSSIELEDDGAAIMSVGGLLCLSAFWQQVTHRPRRYHFDLAINVGSHYLTKFVEEG